MENSISSRGTSQYKHPETEAARVFKEQPKAAGGEEENRNRPDAGGGGHKDKADGMALQAMSRKQIRDDLGLLRKLLLLLETEHGVQQSVAAAKATAPGLTALNTQDQLTLCGLGSRLLPSRSLSSGSWSQQGLG